MGVLLGEKRPPQQSLLSACRDFSSCSRTQRGELPKPRSLCTEPALGARRKASPFPQSAIPNATPGQGFNSHFSHICHVASAHGSFSQPGLPVLTRAQVTNISGHQSRRGPWSPSGAERGAEAGTERAFGVGLAEQLQENVEQEEKEGAGALCPEERAH